MSELLSKIDARTKLAGNNKLEILMFTLGINPRTERRETYGINVFKVREVLRTPPITRAPEMPETVEGMVSLRGRLIPVIGLAKYIGIPLETIPDIMIITEYNGHTQGFLVESVDTILRLDWSAMRVPPEMVNTPLGGLVTAVTELPDGRLVMMLDVERVLAETAQLGEDESIYRNVQPLGLNNHRVFYADDSSVARKQIARTLEAMGVKGISAVNGRQAWDELRHMADQAESSHTPLKDLLHLILTDVEMPEMDGYMLTRKIKEDKRFTGIPVLMHSSLSGSSNQQLGKTVGVDEYISKFEPNRLASTLTRLLKGAEAP
ncbi:chemotaxis protein [Ferrovum myxofaciens]|jgi:two-component system chemotaxis response regulator CheV|uniref:Chemotaxis protein CheV n=2 Tax=root TaxID=1 RepID=A0A8F3DTJ1_9PROT|nr:chemotaxis protein [Ferrovum myxofaciens]MBW8029254.1 response regulator [Ferrovum sp.]KXW58337.1 chemotaxis protein CheV [Ferrovum myxofaciens]NDU90795.1 chemotaxis protein CheV [Ferrovum sp.]QKE38587.1 MAG: chemotaxis protein CheV [Ferrovum myxofaciens]QKE41124.1 MAG: chemotaxis protein CheV [Ferrovum myxofaciens]